MLNTRASSRPPTCTHVPPAAAITTERQIEGEEIKVMQPRQNRKKKVKGRIYQKMKKAADDEGEVGDVMEDIAEDKVVRIAQDQNLELRRMGDKWVGADGVEVEVEVEEEEEIDLEYDSDDAQSQYTATSGVDDYEAYVREEQNITEEEEAAFNMFLSETGGKKLKTIADLIEEQMQKQAARARGGDMEMEEGEEAEFQDLEPQIVEVYKGVGKLLTRYKSGKLPKALKIVPSLRYASCT
jgi:essential nuclear protein 1